MSGIIAQNSGRHTGLVKASSGGGVWNLIETLTSDGSDATLDFTSGIDSTYDEYVFKIINMHPESDTQRFTFQGNAAGGSGYNETITSTAFKAYHFEDDSATALTYDTGEDQAQGTAFQPLSSTCGNDNDQHYSGYLHLFNPSSDVFVKHFISRGVVAHDENLMIDDYFAGYFNTASPVDSIRFKMSADAIDAGDICLYGIST